MGEALATREIHTPLGPFRVYAAGTITRALEAGQWWDDHLQPILDEAAPGTAIDIGAHFGWFTIYLAQSHPRVIAVEPYQPSFALLQENVRRRQGLEHRVQCWPLAAYDQAVALEFAPQNDRTDAGAFGFTLPRPDQPLTATPVVGLPLDPYLNPAYPVTVIKCDAQGADLRALRGLEQTIQRDRPLIVFEWEAGMAGWQGDAWEDYLKFFEGIHYSAERITLDYWDFVARPR